MLDTYDSGGPGGGGNLFFQSSIIEPRSRDEHERKLERYLQSITKMTSSLSETEAIDALTLHINKGSYEEVQLGLLCTILSSPQNAPKSFKWLTLTNRDQWKCVRDCLFTFTSKWRRLTETTQAQIVWFTGEMLRLGHNPVNLDLVQLLFRNVTPGDLSSRNVWLAESLLRLFTEHRAALDRQQFLVDCIVYCFLSIIIDHCHQSVSNALRKAEIDFTVSLLREKWDECCGIGRDLVRLLHGVARIPEFESIWYDLLHSPSSLSPGFQGLISLLRRRTSRRFLLLRITPELEQKFFFVTSKVRMSGPFGRHLEWLKKCVMASSGPTLRCELIRYICGLIHPSMEVINSDVIQRWYIIGWLLKCNPQAAPADIALAKLALFFDWLGFDPATDNVMNIEPGVLLIYHSQKSQMGPMASSLLDFLCRVSASFHPPVAEDIRLAIVMAFRHLHEKRVVPLPSIGMLFDARHIEQDVFFLCRQTFPELLPQPNAQPAQPVPNQASSKFSDDDEPNTVIAVESNKVHHVSDSLVYKPLVFADEVEILNEVEQQMEWLGSDLNAAVRQISQAGENESVIQAVAEVLRRYQAALEEDDDSSRIISALPVCLLSALRPYIIAKSPLPSLSASLDALEESLKVPNFVIFHSIAMSSMDEDDLAARSSLLSLVSAMTARQGRVLVHFLYFLAVKQTEGSISKSQISQLLHELLALASQDDSKPRIEQLIMGSLEFAQRMDTQLFVYLLPFVYSNFRQLFESEGHCTRLLHLACEACDARQLAFISANILLRQLSFFTETNVTALLSATLHWETLEQMFAWQMYFAHSWIPIAKLTPLLTKLRPEKNHEALVAIANRFAQLPPSPEIVGAVLSRSATPSEFTVPALLKSWADVNPQQLNESLNQLLNAGPRRNQTNKLARAGPGLSRDQLLAHLERFRQTSQDAAFLQLPPVQRLLQSLNQQSTEHSKNKYADLFALIDDKLVVGEVPLSNSTANFSTSNNSSTPIPSSSPTFIDSIINNSNHSSGVSSGPNSPLSALSLLDSVASNVSPAIEQQQNVPKLSGKLRRVPKRSPSQVPGPSSKMTKFGGTLAE